MIDIDFAVTTGQNTSSCLNLLAKKWAKDLGVKFIERSKGTLADLLKEQNLSAVIISTADGAKLYSPDGMLFFHTSLSTLRIKNIINGQGDRLINALQLQKGMRVLDCTLGLASDACVMSYVVGQTGRVVGLEGSKPVAFVISKGLMNYKSEDVSLQDIYQKIEVVPVKALDYLLTLPDKFFNVVYFDPMFDNALKRSSSIKPLRLVAYKEPLDEKTLLEALRVASKRVVIKLSRYDSLIEGFDIKITTDGKYSKVKYGVIEVAK